MRPRARVVARALLQGAVIGLIVLGIGGRLAMAGIQFQTTGDPNWSLGGSMTVILLGAVSGIAGAALRLAAEWATARMRGPSWTTHALWGALLLLVTMRGLHGSPSVGARYFYPLVFIYAVVVTLRRGAKSTTATLTNDSN